jgi:hypothetical protein
MGVIDKIPTVISKFWSWCANRKLRARAREISGIMVKFGNCSENYSQCNFDGFVNTMSISSRDAKQPLSAGWRYGASQRLGICNAGADFS